MAFYPTVHKELFYFGKEAFISVNKVPEHEIRFKRIYM